MITNLYERLSEERKRLQTEQLIPDWYTSAGYQLFKEKYEYDTNGRSVRGQFERIARTAAKHLVGTKYEAEAEAKFFNLLWEGLLSPSTPVLANMGTNRGMPVSCSGGTITDSIHGFYSDLTETALLTKHGFGTSSYMGDIRQRGAAISVGGKASGVLPVFKDRIHTMRNVAQGTARRGAWAGYLPIDHGDFDELADHVASEPDDANIGWNISDAYIAKLKAGDAEATRRFQKVLKLKMLTGKGYFCFVDKINRHSPDTYKKFGLTVKAQNLCTEVSLFAGMYKGEDHTFTCVLSSANVVKWDMIKSTDAVYWMTIFLDCVASEFISRAEHVKGLESAVRATKRGRALGLGQCGFHTLLQQRMIPFEGLEAHMLSQEIAKHIWDETLRASQDMAIELGEPEWCEGFGIRNTHRVAPAPTKSTALLMGGVSEGVNPDPAMTFTQSTAAGEVDRINPTLLTLMKKKGVYTKQNIAQVTEAFGSVQHVDWLDTYEKSVFKTAFEIDQMAILRLASARGKFIDQWQSLNLFFQADEPEENIAAVHQAAFLDEGIRGLYYIYSKSGIGASKISECVACQ